ncbi:MAG TPA: hypothetical protein VG253_17020 [Streptosporangiaceae bacterium]|nr:hypothetical protein [Streptosporangiaceae bacterium]
MATEALLVLRDNLADVAAAKAMMCVHGDAGLGKTLSVNASLRALAPADACRVAVPGAAYIWQAAIASGCPGHIRCFFGQDYWDPMGAQCCCARQRRGEPQVCGIFWPRAA